MQKQTAGNKGNKILGGMIQSAKSLMEGTPKIYDLLSQDHRTVETLFTQIENASDFEKKKELIHQLVSELSAHAEAEQKVFYNNLKKEGDDKTQDIVLEAVEEHKLVTILLEEVSRMRKDSSVLDAKIKVLKELVQHHVEEEENEMFKKAKSCYDAEEEITLGQKFLKAKEQLLKN